MASGKPRRQLLHRVLPGQKEQIRTNISVVCCRNPAYSNNILWTFLSQTPEPGDVNLDPQTTVKFTLMYCTVVKISPTNVLVEKGSKPIS